MDIKKSVRPIIENLIAYYLPILGSIAVLVLAWLSRQLSLWQMVLLFFGLLVLAILAINQISVLKERNTKRLSSKSDEEIERILQQWFLKGGWTVGEDKQVGTLFQFAATNRQKSIVLVSRHKDLPGAIQLWVSAILDEKEQAKFAALSQSKRRETLTDLKIEMARFGVQWEGLSDPLKEIKLKDLIPLDSLTELQFLKQAWFIVRAQVLLQQVIFKTVNRFE